MNFEGGSKGKMSLRERVRRQLAGKSNVDPNLPARTFELGIGDGGKESSAERSSAADSETAHDDATEEAAATPREAPPIVLNVGVESDKSRKAGAEGDPKSDNKAFRIKEKAEKKSESVSDPDAEPARPRDGGATIRAKPWLGPVDERSRVGFKETFKSLKEIAADEKANIQFAKIVRKQAPAEADALLTKFLTTGEFTEDEQKLISYSQWELAKIAKHSEEAKSHINAQLVERLMQRDKSLQFLGEAQKPEDIAEIWKDKLELLAIDEPALFDKFRHASHKLERAQKSIFFQSYERRANALADAVGIHVDELGAMFDFKDVESREATRKNLINREREHMSRVRKIIDNVATLVIVPNPLYPLAPVGDRILFQFGSRGRASRRMEKARRLQGQLDDSKYMSKLRPNTWAVTEVRNNLNTMAVFAKKTLVDNKELRSAISKAAVSGEKVKLTEELGPQSFAAMREAEIPESTLSKLWERARLNAPFIDGRDWDKYEPHEKQDYLNRWKPREVIDREENRKGSGWFATALRLLFSAKFEARKKKLSLENIRDMKKGRSEKDSEKTK